MYFLKFFWLNLKMSCNTVAKKQKVFQETERLFFKKWSHLGSNQGPSDYESDALTN